MHLNSVCGSFLRGMRRTHLQKTNGAISGSDQNYMWQSRQDGEHPANFEACSL